MIYKAILSCAGVTEEEGPVAAVDVTEEFTHRPWHKNVTCRWQNRLLVLKAENDFDDDGMALLDEFSDALCACISGNIGEIKIESVKRITKKKKSQPAAGASAHGRQF